MKDDEVITGRQLKLFWKMVKGELKKLDDRITECYSDMAAADDVQSGFWNEHEEKIARLNRSLRRLQKELTQ